MLEKWRTNLTFETRCFTRKIVDFGIKKAYVLAFIGKIACFLIKKLTFCKNLISISFCWLKHLIKQFSTCKFGCNRNRKISPLMRNLNHSMLENSVYNCRHALSGAISVIS